ncbi:MAG: lipocalin family protein [Candidatus Melainabacteria bacterium]|nr:lipocalin family protein [Candidatus Melainabacteria bacterium]
MSPIVQLKGYAEGAHSEAIRAKAGQTKAGQTKSAQTKPASPLQPVPLVDLTRYSGSWYEVALIPYFFQKHCATNAWVEYSPLPNGQYKDYFQCDKANGKVQKLTGRVKSVSPSNSVLSATFLNLLGWRYWFGPNYWIIGLDDDYQFAVVGEPKRQHGWVLSRKPTLSPTQWQAVAQALTHNGYDSCEFRLSPQTQRLQQPEALCRYLERNRP